MVAFLIIHELGNKFVKIALIFFEKIKLGQLSEISNGKIQFIDVIGNWNLGSWVSNPQFTQIILLLKELHSPKWAWIKYKCHTFIWKKTQNSLGIYFIWSHTCLQLKQIRYPSFQHSYYRKGLTGILQRSLRICHRWWHPTDRTERNDNLVRNICSHFLISFSWFIHWAKLVSHELRVTSISLLLPTSGKILDKGFLY